MPVNILAVTSITRVQMASGPPGVADGTVYTVPTAATAKITQLIICNTTAAAATLTMSLVPPAGVVDGTHRVLTGFSVGPNDMVIVDFAQYLDAGGFISAKQGTAGALDITISGEVYV